MRAGGGRRSPPPAARSPACDLRPPVIPEFAPANFQDPAAPGGLVSYAFAFFVLLLLAGEASVVGEGVGRLGLSSLNPARIARARASMASTNAGINACVPAGMASTSASAAFTCRDTAFASSSTRLISRGPLSPQSPANACQCLRFEMLAAVLAGDLLCQVARYALPGRRAHDVVDGRQAEASAGDHQRIVLGVRVGVAGQDVEDAHSRAGGEHRAPAWRCGSTANMSARVGPLMPVWLASYLADGGLPSAWQKSSWCSRRQRPACSTRS